MGGETGGRAKYKRDIDVGWQGAAGSSSSEYYDSYYSHYYGFLCLLALEVFDTTEALGALALGEGRGALDVGAIDLSKMKGKQASRVEWVGNTRYIPCCSRGNGSWVGGRRRVGTGGTGSRQWPRCRSACSADSLGRQSRH